MNILQNVLLYTKGFRRTMEKELGITRAREELSIIVEQVQYQGDTYVINRHGKPAAAVVPMQVYETWKRERENFFNFIRQTQEQANLEPEEADKIAADAVKAIRATS